MKVFLGTLAALAIVVCVNSSEDVSESSNSVEFDESKCPEKVDLLIRRTLFSLAPESSRSLEVSKMTPSEMRLFIKGYCYNRQPVRQCLQDVIDGTKKCYTSDRQRGFELFKDFLEVSLEVVCSQYGEKLVRVYQDIYSLIADQGDLETLRTIASTCMEAAETGLNPPEDLELGQRIDRLYRLLKGFRKCFVNKARNVVRTMDDIDDMLRKILEKMKCTDPDSEALVLCQVVIDGKGKEVDCRVLEGKTQLELMGRGWQCLTSNHTGISPAGPRAMSLLEARALVKDYCDDQEPVRQCLSEMVQHAVKCLDESQHSAFNLWQSNLQVLLDALCYHNGRKFANIYLENHLTLTDTEHREKLTDLSRTCTEVADTHEMISGGIMGFIMRSSQDYIKLKAFRQCFVERGKNVMTSINEFADISRDFLAKAKCIHPQDKGVVLCSDLDDEGTRNRTCPLEVDADDKKKARQQLFDMGFHCISVKNLTFEHLTNDSSSAELKAFVKEYCQGLPAVRDCLHNVSSIADVCLGTPRHRIFQVLQEMLETTMQTGCVEDGDRLATIFTSLREDTSGEATNAMYECIGMSVLKLKMVPVVEEEAGADSMRVYRELQSFEECLVNEIQDGAFKNVTETFLTDVMRELNCADHPEGETVLCKNIALPKPAEEES